MVINAFVVVSKSNLEIKKLIVFLLTNRKIETAFI